MLTFVMDFIYHHKKVSIMKANLGKYDRIIRFLSLVVIAILYFTHLISGTAAIVLLIVTGVLALTSLINFCPLYYLFGISSKKKEK